MNTESIKRCPKCGLAKAASAFNKNRSNAGGLGNWCRECQSNFARQYRAEHRKEAREYGWRYYAAHRKELQERAQRRREARLKRAQESVRRHPEKACSRRQLKQAVHRGLIKKPDFCDECGRSVEKTKLHGHHAWGYKQWDRVEWLCSGCHGKAHRIPDQEIQEAIHG